MEADGLPELSFVHPMPGFPALRRFVLVRMDSDAPAEAAVEDPSSVLYELRSLERPEIRFMAAVPTAFFPEYDIELDPASCEDLSLTESDDAVVLSILTVAGDVVTANLLAPVVINARTRDAAQLILAGTDWPVRALVH